MQVFTTQDFFCYYEYLAKGAARDEKNTEDNPDTPP